MQMDNVLREVHVVPESSSVIKVAIYSPRSPLLFKQSQKFGENLRIHSLLKILRNLNGFSYISIFHTKLYGKIPWILAKMEES